MQLMTTRILTRFYICTFLFVPCFSFPAGLEALVSGSIPIHHYGVPLNKLYKKHSSSLNQVDFNTTRLSPLPQMLDVHATLHQMGLYKMKHQKEFICVDFSFVFFHEYQRRMQSMGFRENSVWQVGLSRHALNVVKFSYPNGYDYGYAVIEPDLDPSKNDPVLVVVKNSRNTDPPHFSAKEVRRIADAYQRIGQTNRAASIRSDLNIEVRAGTHFAFTPQIPNFPQIPNYLRGPYYDRRNTVEELVQNTGIYIPIRRPPTMNLDGSYDP